MMCIHHAQGSESPLKVAYSELEHTEQLHGHLELGLRMFFGGFDTFFWARLESVVID